MILNKMTLGLGLISALALNAGALETYTDSVGALNKFLTSNPDLRTYDNKKCHINISSEWKAEGQKFKLSVQLTAESQGEIAQFSIDTVHISEQYQSHLMTSSNPLRISVTNYVSDGFGFWAENAKHLQLSPYSIRIVDVDPTSGEPISQVACTLPDLPLMYRNL